MWQVTFCETKYAIFPFAAEFWNTASSTIYVYELRAWPTLCFPFRIMCGGTPFLGRRYVAYRTLKEVPSRSLWSPAFWVAVVGIGSCLLHGTNRWLGQLMDEVPMLFWVVSWLVCMKGCHSWTMGLKGRAFYLIVSLITFGAILAYVVFKRCVLLVPVCVSRYGLASMPTGPTFCHARRQPAGTRFFCTALRPKSPCCVS